MWTKHISNILEWLVYLAASLLRCFPAGVVPVAHADCLQNCFFTSMFVEAFPRKDYSFHIPSKDRGNWGIRNKIGPTTKRLDYRLRLCFCSMIWALQNEWLFLRASALTLRNFYCLRVTVSYQISKELYHLKVPLRVLVESTPGSAGRPGHFRFL